MDDREEPILDYEEGENRQEDSEVENEPVSDDFDSNVDYVERLVLDIKKFAQTRGLPLCQYLNSALFLDFLNS